MVEFISYNASFCIIVVISRMIIFLDWLDFFATISPTAVTASYRQALTMAGAVRPRKRRLLSNRPHPQPQTRPPSTTDATQISQNWNLSQR